VAGNRSLYCPLPRAGWFPDEDDPGPLPDDPADEAPAVRPDTPTRDRLLVLEAVLDAAAQQMR